MLIGRWEEPMGLIHVVTAPCKARNGRNEAVMRMCVVQNRIRLRMSTGREKAGPVRLEVWRTTAMRRRTLLAPIEEFIESRRRVEL